ncbi:hypothetical protein ABTE84_20230, partial [Acinetobacter baumannii]
HDFANGQIAMTSQRRFSFLPSIFAIKAVFPLVAQDNGQRVAGLYIPGNFVYTKSAQVIVPRFTSNGKLESVLRPAAFQLEAQKGCS